MTGWNNPAPKKDKGGAETLRRKGKIMNEIITRKTIKNTLEAYASRIERLDEKLDLLEYRQDAISAHIEEAENDLTVSLETMEQLYKLNDDNCGNIRRVMKRQTSFVKAIKKLEELDEILEELGY